MRFRRSLALTGASLILFSLCSCGTFRKKDKQEGEDDAVNEDGATEEVATEEPPDDGPPTVSALPGESERDTEFRQACAERAYTAGGKAAVEGRDGWFFSSAELKRLADGATVESPAFDAAVAAITDYDKELRQRGIQLVVVPVPAKANLYPDVLSPEWKLSKRKVKRFDPYHRALYAELGSRGVQVVDLMDDLLDERYAKTGAMYPKSGAHWSPRAAERAARAALEKLGGAGEMPEDLKVTGLDIQEGNVAVTQPLPGLPSTASESVPARSVTGDALSSKAPVLVIGDTNAGHLSGAGASFAHQLAYEGRVPVRLYENGSDGRNAPRRRLLRQSVQSPGFLNGKKAVFWVFNASELLRSDWQRIPVSLSIRRIEEGLRESQ